MALTGLELLTDWLLAEGHQCAATDSKRPCWCQQEDIKQRQEHVREEAECNQNGQSTKKQQAPTLLGPGIASKDATPEREKLLNGDSSNLVGTQQDKQPEHDVALLDGQTQPKHPAGQQCEQHKQPRRWPAYQNEAADSKLKPAYFLSLPAEIRLRIYRHLFLRKFYHWYWHSRSLAVEHRIWSAFLRPFKYPMALLETCKTINHEATAEMYNRIVVVCDLRPDRLLGFHLVSVQRSFPRLEMITRIVINIQLDVQYAANGHQPAVHRYVMPAHANYRQLRFLRCLTRLGLRVVTDNYARLPQAHQRYEGILRLHVEQILMSVGSKVVLEGVGNWEPLWRANEVCSSLEGELREVAASKDWVSTVIAKVRR